MHSIPEDVILNLRFFCIYVLPCRTWHVSHVYVDLPTHERWTTDVRAPSAPGRVDTRSHCSSTPCRLCGFVPLWGRVQRRAPLTSPGAIYQVHARAAPARPRRPARARVPRSHVVRGQRELSRRTRDSRVPGALSDRTLIPIGSVRPVPVARDASVARRGPMAWWSPESYHRRRERCSCRRSSLRSERRLTCWHGYVHGVDMAEVTDAQVSLIWELIYSRKVVFFRDQGHISREQHIAFGNRFAEVGLAFGRHQALSTNTSPDEYPQILPLYADENAAFVPANWHSDVTWAEKPALGPILLSRKISTHWRGHYVCR